MSEIKEKPCPVCPPDCPRQNETCKLFCKIFKERYRDHKPPEPKVTVAEKYCNEMNKKAREKVLKRGGRHY